MKISVITPIYKGNEYIPRLCKMISENAKILKSRYHNSQVEYILVNDYPIEPLIDLEKCQIDAVSIVQLQNKKNMGIHQSRVNALEKASGDYILFLDQDDEIEKNTLLSQINTIKANEKSELNTQDIDMVISNGYRKFEDRVVPLYSKTAALKLAKKEKMYIYGTDMILSPGQCLIKKNSIPKEWKNNILQVNGCDDFFLWLLMFQKHCRFCLNKEKLYFHTESSNNYSASSDNMTKSFAAMCSLMEEQKLIDKWKIIALKRRCRVKALLKKEKSVLKKAGMVLVNLDVMMFVLYYKICGYY